MLQEDEPDEEEDREQARAEIRRGETGTAEENRKGKPESNKGGGKTNDWMSLGVGEIVVDSAADESCWPKGLGDAFPTRPPRKSILLRTANGGEMQHYGEKKITFAGSNDGDVTGVTFQVTDVKKPLLAVRRLVERGSSVSFGPSPEDNYIINIHTRV